MDVVQAIFPHDRGGKFSLFAKQRGLTAGIFSSGSFKASDNEFISFAGKRFTVVSVVASFVSCGAVARSGTDGIVVESAPKK